MEQFGDPRANPKQLPVKPLGEVCMVERGGSPRPIADYVTDSEDGINWIKIGDADGTRYITVIKKTPNPPCKVCLPSVSA